MATSEKNRVTIRFSEAEVARLRTLAEAMGIGVAEVVRHILNTTGNGAGTPPDFSKIEARLDGLEATIEKRFSELEAGLKTFVQTLAQTQGQRTENRPAAKPELPSYHVWATQQPWLQNETRDERVARLQAEYQKLKEENNAIR